MGELSGANASVGAVGTVGLGLRWGAVTAGTEAGRGGLPSVHETFLGTDGCWYQPAPTTSLTPAPPSLKIGRYSSPWMVYRHILGVVVITFMIAQGVVIAWMGIAERDGWLAFVGGLCVLPFVGLLLVLTRPRLAHVRIAVPTPTGGLYHSMPGDETLITPMPSRFAQHIIRDDSSLDTPPSRTVWLLFAGLMATSVALALALLTGVAFPLVLTLAIIVGIPAWLFGFSIPVLAWWSYSSETLGLDTRRRDAEAWLVAGMLSAIPALIINSFVAPTMIPASASEQVSEFLIVALSAPVGEELCKGLAAALFIGRMRGRKHGFQIGFTVGLGFAMIENLQYILLSFGGGYVSFTVTALMRGIGSIPGHAFWTGMTGFALGALAVRLPHRLPLLDPHGESAKREVPWLLVDPKSGRTISHSEMAASPADPTGRLLEIEVPIIEMAVPVVDGGFEMREVDAGDAARLPDPDGPRGLMPSSSLPIGIGLAMLGHATWNGTSIIVPWLVESAGFGELAVVLVSLLWIAVLVTAVLLLGRGMLRAVRGLDAADSRERSETLLEGIIHG